VNRLRLFSGELPPEDWASVRRTLRQLGQALAYVHSHKIAHRDVKPENVLWRDAPGGTIALADFGISRDMNAALESTLAPGGGTAAYAAPEAGTPAWRDTPWAADVWAFGMMALEIATGKLYCWTGRRLEVVGAPELGAFVAPQSGGPALQNLVSLALACLSPTASARPSADECLLHSFFSASEAAPADAAGPGSDGTALAAKLASLMVAAHSGGAPWPLRLLAPPEDNAQASAQWASALLDAVASAPLDALRRPWEVVLGAAGAPLSAALRALWRTVPAVPGLLARSSPDGVDLPFMPAEDVSGGRLRQLSGLGRIMAKCLLEGLAVGLELAPTAYAALLGCESAALASTGGALAHAAAWDEGLAASHRATLARRLGAGSSLLTADTYLENGDETPLSDVTKNAVICAAVHRTLVSKRRAGLDALRTGFCDTAEAADFLPSLRVFTEWELGCLYMTSLDSDVLRRGVVWDANDWQANEPQRAWLDAALAALSEPALRRLMARAAGRLRLPQSGPTLLVLRRRGNEADTAPRFPGNSILELAPQCPSAEAFTARLLNALHLGDAAAQQGRPDAATLVAEQRAAIRALQRTGTVKRGAVYQCPNGHVYTIGNCGGAMEQGTCPECGAVIGGAQHRAAAGNTVRLDVDGADQPAWPPN